MGHDLDDAGLPEVTREPAEAVEAYLRGFLDAIDLPESLLDAIRYALLDGGKRLRPVLAWWSSAAAGGPGEASVPAGAALELIHAFSLVHDDLPAMDDDDLRRGRPTLHRHAGEAMAILAGDAMTVLAFRVLSDGCPSPDLSRALIAELAGASCGMIGGQVFDTLGGFSDEKPAADRLETIHRSKTGALIRAACRMGCICGCSAQGRIDDALVASLTRFGEAIGLMFQIIDDLLDVEQTCEQVGKATGKDARAGKLTYPVLFGVAASRERVKELEHEALGSIEDLGPGADPLRELCRYLARRNR
jgi:geranylgeranyl pyrophosphate synthase